MQQFRIEGCEIHFTRVLTESSLEDRYQIHLDPGGELNLLFLGILDLFTSDVAGKGLRYHCTSHDVKMIMDFAFLDWGVDVVSKVMMRIDNGTQSVSGMLELFLSSLSIPHEMIHLRNTEGVNANRIFQFEIGEEVICRFEFSSFEDTMITIERFIAFCNSKWLY